MSFGYVTLSRSFDLPTIRLPNVSEMNRCLRGSLGELLLMGVFASSLQVTAYL